MLHKKAVFNKGLFLEQRVTINIISRLHWQDNIFLANLFHCVLYQRKMDNLHVRLKIFSKSYGEVYFFYLLNFREERVTTK